jgi:hypothetical protein
VILDSKSGILCAFNAGNTVVTISAGGLSYSVPVTVLGGSVEQPCGTVPLAAGRFAKVSSAASAGATSPPPPAPAPAPAPIAPPPPPPAAPAAPAPLAKPAIKSPPPAAALLFTPLLLALQNGVPAIPPPPPGAFARPIPPGGAGVRVFEEKKEEEEATEQSQAFAAYRAEDYRGLPVGARAYAGANGGNNSPTPAVYLLCLVVLAAAGGVTLRFGPRRRGHPIETAYATAGTCSARVQANRVYQIPRKSRLRRQRP